MNEYEYMEILSHLSDRASEVLQESGIPKDRADRISRQIADAFGLDLAGQQVYFGKSVALSERDLKIYREFDGANHARLARRYNLTERQVYNIISRVRAEEIRRRQIPLFPEN